MCGISYGSRIFIANQTFSSTLNWIDWGFLFVRKQDLLRLLCFCTEVLRLARWYPPLRARFHSAWPFELFPFGILWIFTPNAICPCYLQFFSFQLRTCACCCHPKDNETLLTNRPHFLVFPEMVIQCAFIEHMWWRIRVPIMFTLRNLRYHIVYSIQQRPISKYWKPCAISSNGGKIRFYAILRAALRQIDWCASMGVWCSWCVQTRVFSHSVLSCLYMCACVVWHRKRRLQQQHFSRSLTMTRLFINPENPPGGLPSPCSVSFSDVHVAVSVVVFRSYINTHVGWGILCILRCDAMWQKQPHDCVGSLITCDDNAGMCVLQINNIRTLTLARTLPDMHSQVAWLPEWKFRTLNSVDFNHGDKFVYVLSTTKISRTREHYWSRMPLEDIDVFFASECERDGNTPFYYLECTECVSNTQQQHIDWRQRQQMGHIKFTSERQPERWLHLRVAIISSFMSVCFCVCVCANVTTTPPNQLIVRRPASKRIQLQVV